MDNPQPDLAPQTSTLTETHHKPDVRRAPPAIALLIVNLVPLAGVLFGGWSLLEIVSLYWFENVVIGAINVLKMITCAPDIEYMRSMQQSMSSERDPRRRVQQSLKISQVSAIGHHAAKFFIVPFFIVHYGIFCTVHGVFVFVLLSGQQPGGFANEFPLRPLLANVLSGGTKFAALALIASHLISYVHHFLLRGEYRRTTVMHLMAAPYARIVLLHVAILFGAFAIHLLGQPMLLLILLIAGKTFLDWTMHVRTHNKLESSAHGTITTV